MQIQTRPRIRHLTDTEKHVIVSAIGWNIEQFERGFIATAVHDMAVRDLAKGLIHDIGARPASMPTEGKGPHFRCSHDARFVTACVATWAFTRVKHASTGGFYTLCEELTDKKVNGWYDMMALRDWPSGHQHCEIYPR